MCRAGRAEFNKWAPSWPPESPWPDPPRGCELGRGSSLAGKAFPTLQPLAAPGLQPTPQGQGLESPPWPLETGSLETCSLHSGLGQGPGSGGAPGPGSSRVRCRC